MIFISLIRPILMDTWRHVPDQASAQRSKSRQFFLLMGIQLSSPLRKTRGGLSCLIKIKTETMVTVVHKRPRQPKEPHAYRCREKYFIFLALLAAQYLALASLLFVPQRITSNLLLLPPLLLGFRSNFDCRNMKLNSILSESLNP